MTPCSIRREAIFDAAGERRFLLTREWSSGPLIVWAGLNPSVAGRDADDMTIRKEIGFSKRWGFGRMAALNLIPIVSTDPWKLPPCSGLDVTNRAYLHDWVTKADLVVLAWGSVPSALSRRLQLSAHIVDLLTHVTREFHCIGITSDGSPLHPSRAGYTERPQVFAVGSERSYLRRAR